MVSYPGRVFEKDKNEMKFFKYIKENNYVKKTRVTQITQEVFAEETKKYCQEALSNRVPIWRGTLTKVDFGKMQPNKWKRISANTSNWYTIFMNNSPIWKQYPKRSLICTFNPYKAEDYGFTYRILPVDGAKIGICKKDDLWDSMEYAGPGINDMSDFSQTLGIVFAEVEDNMYLSSEDTTWAQFKKMAKKVGPHMENFKQTEGMGKHYPWYMTEKLGYTGGDFMKFLENNLNPDRNGFKVYPIGGIPKSYRMKNNEVWLDADCYIILADNQDAMGIKV
jgi:hypothetical protein